MTVICCVPEFESRTLISATVLITFQSTSYVDSPARPARGPHPDCRRSELTAVECLWAGPRALDAHTVTESADRTGLMSGLRPATRRPADNAACGFIKTNWALMQLYTVGISARERHRERERERQKTTFPWHGDFVCQPCRINVGWLQRYKNCTP